MQNQPLFCAGKDPHPPKCGFSNALSFHRCTYNKQVSSCAHGENWERWSWLGLCPFLLFLCSSLSGENTYRQTLSSQHSFSKIAASLDVLVWVHPQPVSEQGGLTLGCSVADLLMIWYFEAKRLMVNLSHQHICIQQRVGVLSQTYLAVLSVWFVGQKYVYEDQLLQCKFFVFQI